MHGILIYEIIRHIHESVFIGHTLNCKFPKRIGSIIIRLFPYWGDDRYTEFKFELSPEKSIEKSMNLSFENEILPFIFGNW